ncbi:MAG: hypothetical protein U0790_00870 [Isosphaeraceae bacterium]
MPPWLTAQQKEAAEARRWALIVDKIAAELKALERSRPSSFRVALLRQMLEAVADADWDSLAASATEYVRRTRVLPPGVYATCSPPGRTFYLDGERLEPGRRVASLTLAPIHDQVYR